MHNTMAQTVNFNFSDAPNVVSGWINVHGDPSLAVITATDATTGISISSVATANWVQYARTNAAYDGGGMTNGTYFPAAVMLDQWFQYNPAGSGTAYYNEAIPQLILSGLKTDSVYKIKISSSMALGFDSDPSHYTVVGSTVYGPIDLNTNNNTANGAEFDNIAPDSAGHVKIYINTIANTEAADISGLQLIGTGTSGVTPVVRIINPANNDVLGDGGNITINATASETGGSISKVEFFVDTTKIGQSTTAPYTVTWTNPNEGHYTLTAKATDAAGLTSTSTIMVSVESLSYFWSTTGNSNTGGDTSFIGTVDSNRLAFRTKNIERMSISPTGTVMVGTDTLEDSLVLQGNMYIEDTMSDAPVTIEANSIYSPWINYINNSPAYGASIGSRYWNDSGLVAQFFSGSSNDHFMPNGFAFHDISGGGFDFVSFQPNSFVSWGNNFKHLGGSKMIFYPGTGHLIIGSTRDTGNYLLQVNGSAIFTKIMVKPFASWPDYVFKKGYALPDLNDVELYIRVHHHLPGIASEEDVRSGIDVGEQQSAVLKKVEELTLYLIRENKTLTEQNKQMKDQTRQLAEQNARLEAQQKEIDELKAMMQANSKK